MVREATALPWSGFPSFLGPRPPPPLLPSPHTYTMAAGTIDGLDFCHRHGHV